MGIIFQKSVPVLRLNAHVVKIFIRGSGIFNGFLMNVHKKLQQLSACQKLRHGGRGQHIANILRHHITNTLICFKIESAAVCPDIPVQAIEKRGLSGTVSPQQPINPAAFKRKIYIPENLLFLIAFR